MPRERPKKKRKKSMIVVCPRCMADMLAKDSRYGMFYSCSRYPRCDGRVTKHWTL